MPGTNRLLCLGASVLLVSLAAQPTPAVAHDLPRTYVVARSPGVLPEGIAIDGDGTMYVSSDGTGALYRGNVRAPACVPSARTASRTARAPWGCTPTPRVGSSRWEAPS